MKVSEMKDEEKSILLARMLKKQMLPNKYMPIDSPEFRGVNLYLPGNMPLAWRVLNWAAERKDELNDYSYPYYFAQGVEELFDTTEEIPCQIWALPPEDAQRRWLDRILELAIEAKLVEP